MCFPRRRRGSGALDAACLGVGHLVWRGRDSWSQRPLSQRPARARSHLPPVPPQEHKAEVKASMTASFPAVGRRGPRAVTQGARHGSSARRHGDTPASWARRDTWSQDPHPQLAVCPSVHPPVCQNPEEPWRRVAVGQGLASPQTRRPRHTTSFPQVPERQQVRVSQAGGPSVQGTARGPGLSVRF